MTKLHTSRKQNLLPTYLRSADFVCMSTALCVRKRQVPEGAGVLDDIVLLPFVALICVSDLSLAGCSQVLVMSLLFCLLVQEPHTELYRKLGYRRLHPGKG